MLNANPSGVDPSAGRPFGQFSSGGAQIASNGFHIGGANIICYKRCALIQKLVGAMYQVGWVQGVGPQGKWDCRVWLHDGSHLLKSESSRQYCIRVDTL